MNLAVRLSELMFHLTIVLAYCVSIYHIGKLFFRRVSSTESFLVGCILISFYYFTLGMLGLYQKPFLLAVPFFIGLIIQLHDFHKPFVFSTLKFSPYFLILMFILFVLFLFNAFPDTGFDSNWYHLSQPQSYLQAGRLYHVGGYIFPSGYPQFVEMLFLPLLYVGDSLTTSIFSFMFFVLLLVQTTKLMELLCVRKFPAFVGLLVLCLTPSIVTYSGLAYVDNYMAVFLVSAFIFTLQYLQTLNFYNIALAGLMLGAVSTIKYSGGLWGIPLAVFFVLNSFRLQMHTRLKALLFLTITPLFMLSFWLIRNQLQVHKFFNPIGEYPLSMYNTPFANNYAEYMGYIFKNVAQIPFELGVGRFDYAFIFLIFMVLFICLKYKTKIVIRIFLVMFSGIAIWKLMPPGNDLRYFVPFMPIVISFGLHVLSNYTTGIFRLLCLTYLCICSLSNIPLLKTKYSERLPFAFGGLNLNDYRDWFFEKEPFILWDTNGAVRHEIGKEKFIVKGVDLIYPSLLRFPGQIEDYSHAKLNHEQIRSFKDLALEMKRTGYKYFLTNNGDARKLFENEFEVLDDIGNYFDVVVHHINVHGKPIFLYRLRYS